MRLATVSGNVKANETHGLIYFDKSFVKPEGEPQNEWEGLTPHPATEYETKLYDGV